MNMHQQKSRLAALVMLAIATLPLAVYADNPTTTDINWFIMGMELFGGLALFLFGMDQLAESLKASAGEQMKTILSSLTRNRYTAALTGAFVTAVIQSSSITTVLVVGFVSAGLMNLTQSIGVIMGSNVGTTITAQIVAFKVTEAALLLIAVGFFMLFTSRNDRIRHTGGITMGLGMVFFGMGIMSDAMYPLREYEPFLDLMLEMENPLMGILVAAVFTALVQSSSATTGIVIVMASQGFITLPAGIAMALGANIGTCVTALLAAIGKSRQAVQASLVHVLFNIAGALLWLSLISELAEMATAVSPSHPDLQGSERLAAETPRQIANANTLFNVINTLLFLPLAGVFGIIVNRLAPLKPETITRAIEPKYLDKALLGSPSLALEHVRMEVGHLGELVVTQLNEFRDAIVSRQRDYLLTIARQDDRIDSLHDSISVYIESIQKTTLSQSEADQLTALMEASILLEMIGDVVEYDLVPQGLAIIEQGIKYSKTDSVILDKLYESILQAVDTAVHAVTGPDEESADTVLAMKMTIHRHEEEVLSFQRAKLADKTATALRQFQSDITLLERMRHIYSLSKRIVRSMYPDKYQSQTAS